ncbi:MAG: transferrin-binding protein-like solute binding protein, partial [Alphaproteobacteria bacterium]|nr:transferrin-binding protein-like solute binding protein [Alphaproteobacteria bacterium]
INANHLDFSGTLNYGYDATNMVALNDATGDVTGGSGLTGKADARFYGASAQEFGGAFLLANANSYYYGGFGGQVAQYNGDELKTYNLVKPVADLTLDAMAWNRNNPANPMQVAVPTFAIPTDIDGTAYTSIQALRSDTSLGNDSVKSFTLPVLGTHRFYQNEFQRLDATIAWGDGNHNINGNIVNNTNSVVTLNYHVKNGNVYYQGGAGTEGIVLYRKTYDDDGNEITNRYAANTGADNRNYFKGDDILGIDNSIFTNEIKQSRGDSSGTGSNNYFGFVPENIVSLEWALYRNSSELSTTDLTENWDIQFAYLIAGLETGKSFGGAFGTIPTTGNVTFVGKGTGSYGYLRPQYTSVYLSKREQVYFSVAAHVDFASRNINFSTYNTCYATTCRIKREGLDLNANISFDNSGDNVNNMSTNVTSNNGLLAGALNTRFYGNAAQEFGGSFTLMGDNIYYYAIFASNRTFDGTKDDFSVNIISNRRDFEYHYNYPKATNTPYASFAKAASANDASQFVLRGSAVQKHDTTKYVRNGKAIDWNGDVDADADMNIVAVSDVSEVRDISIAGSKTPAVALDFDADGNISAIDASFGFNSYKATVLADGANSITANGAISNADYADAQTSNISADRSAFGFDSNYMVYVNWNFAKTDIDATNSVIADDIYNIGGMMVAGIETQNIPNSGNDIAFNGRGKGNYGDKDADHAVSFKTYADVNFTNRTIAFEASKTACVVGACTLDATTLNTLNFTRSLSYSAGVNRAGQTIRVASTLVGPLYARFYGIGDDSATEFAGTFAVRDSSSYYYGAFGTLKGGIIIPAMANSIADVTIAEAKRQPINIPNNVGGASYPWLSLIIDDYRPVTVQGLAVYRTNNIVYTRLTGQNDWRERNATDTLSVSKLTGATATIKPNAYGNLSELTIHLDNDESYTISDSSNSSNTSFYKSFTKDDVSGVMSINRTSDVFGFSPKNIYYVSWTLKNTTLSDDENLLEDNTYTRRGAMLVGAESDENSIPIVNYPALDSGPIKFSGKGRGYYNDETGVEKGTKFNVTANIDFVNKNISLATSYAELCNANIADCQRDTAFDFVTATPLSYAGSNGISGAIESKTFDDPALAVGSFTGTVDANFYGIDNANEFGGAFTLIDDKYNTHYGIFGTEIDIKSVFNHSFDHLKQDAVDRFPVARGAISPNRSDLKTYNKYDSFFAAQQDSKNGVKYNNVPNHHVHTPGVAAFREDTTRYQRNLADKDTAWDDDDVIADLSFVGNVDNASSLLQYGAGSDGKIYGARAYGNKAAYLLNYANNSLNGHGNITTTSDNDDEYHYITGGNPLKYYTTDTNSQNYPSNIAGNLTVEKPNEFGFTAKYMAYLRWTVTKETEDLNNSKLADRVFDIDGYMVSGFQTEHNNSAGSTDGFKADDLPETGTATFKGAGMGTYHETSGQGYRTNIANVSATAKFADGEIDLTMSGTTCVAGLGDCGETAITSALPNLDVAEMTLTFAVGENDITGVAATTKGGMQGQIDARFYGQNRVGGADKQNAAKEFGGAFSFRDGDKSYIGIFGTSCEASGGVCP